MGPDLAANAERLEPMEPPRGRLEFRWCRHRKDPGCVVGEQRQFFHLALCLTELPCEVGDTSKWECFKSSKLNSAIFIFRSICFMLIFGGFCSAISSILCILQPWEKYKTLQIKWTIIKAVEFEFLYYIYMVFHKLQFSIVLQKLFPFGKTVTNLTCRRNRIICFDWFGEWIVQVKFVYNFSIICRLYIYIYMHFSNK